MLILCALGTVDIRKPEIANVPVRSRKLSTACFELEFNEITPCCRKTVTPSMFLFTPITIPVSLLQRHEDNRYVCPKSRYLYIRF